MTRSSTSPRKRTSRSSKPVVSAKALEPHHFLYKTKVSKTLYQRGLHHQRLKNNILEKKILDAWNEANMGKNNTLLKELMGPYFQMDPSPGLVAATVIQWLGSPVGYHWLCSVMPEFKEKEDE